MTSESQGNYYDEIRMERFQTASVGMEENVCYNKPGAWMNNLALGSGKKKPESKKLIVGTVCVMAVLSVYALLCTAVIAYLFWEVVQLKSETSMLESDTATLKLETAPLQQVMSTKQPNMTDLEEIKVW